MVKVISQFEDLNFSVRNMSIIIKLKLKDMLKWITWNKLANNIFLTWHWRIMLAVNFKIQQYEEGYMFEKKSQQSLLLVWLIDVQLQFAHFPL